MLSRHGSYSKEATVQAVGMMRQLSESIPVSALPVVAMSCLPIRPSWLHGYMSVSYIVTCDAHRQSQGNTAISAVTLPAIARSL